MLKGLILFLLEWYKTKLIKEIERLKNEMPKYRHTKTGLARSVDNEGIQTIKSDLVKINSAINTIEFTKYKKFTQRPKLLCRCKNVKFHRFIYGDEINKWNSRKLYICEDCGTEIALPEDRF